MLRDIDFGLLLTFETINRFRSVTRAAQELGVTQGAVSHSLKRLRSLFNDPLFIRGKEGLLLTERGNALAEPIADILRKAQELVASQITFDPENAARTISLGLNAAGELGVLPTLIRRMRSDAPACTLSSH